MSGWIARETGVHEWMPGDIGWHNEWGAGHTSPMPITMPRPIIVVTAHAGRGVRQAAT